MGQFWPFPRTVAWESESGIHSVSSPPIDWLAQTEPTERKKRNEFRSTTPRLRVLGKGQNWLMVAHQLASAYDFLGNRLRGSLRHNSFLRIQLSLKLRPTRVKRGIDVNSYHTLTCAEH